MGCRSPHAKVQFLGERTCLGTNDTLRWAVQKRLNQSRYPLRELKEACVTWGYTTCSLVNTSEYDWTVHVWWPCKNDWTSQDALWDVDSGGPKEPCIRWGAHWRHLVNSTEYHWTVLVCRQCGFLSNYFEHLFILTTVAEAEQTIIISVNW